MTPGFRLQILLVLCAFSLVSCKDQREIKKTIESVYDLKPELCETQDLSEELQDLLENAKKTTVENNQIYQINGSLVSSRTEGFTSFRVSNIGIRYNKATAIIELVNENSHTEWTDTVQLVYQKRWKLDDVKYNKQNNPVKNTLKEALSVFSKS